MSHDAQPDGPLLQSPRMRRGLRSAIALKQAPGRQNCLALAHFRLAPIRRMPGRECSPAPTLRTSTDSPTTSLRISRKFGVWRLVAQETGFVADVTNQLAW